MTISRAPTQTTASGGSRNLVRQPPREAAVWEEEDGVCREDMLPETDGLGIARGIYVFRFMHRLALHGKIVISRIVAGVGRF